MLKYLTADWVSVPSTTCEYYTDNDNIEVILYHRMDMRVWRKRIGGWGLLLVAGGATVYLVSEWGTDALLMTAFFGVLSLGGVFVISGREKIFYYLLPVVGVLALLKAVGYYLNSGITTLTLLFVLLAAVCIAKGVQAYWTLQRGGGAET